MPLPTHRLRSSKGHEADHGTAENSVIHTRRFKKRLIQSIEPHPKKSCRNETKSFVTKEASSHFLRSKQKSPNNRQTNKAYVALTPISTQSYDSGIGSSLKRPKPPSSKFNSKIYHQRLASPEMENISSSKHDSCDNAELLAFQSSASTPFLARKHRKTSDSCFGFENLTFNDDHVQHMSFSPTKELEGSFLGSLRDDATFERTLPDPGLSPIKDDEPSKENKVLNRPLFDKFEVDQENRLSMSKRTYVNRSNYQEKKIFGCNNFRPSPKIDVVDVKLPLKQTKKDKEFSEQTKLWEQEVNAELENISQFELYVECTKQ